MGNKILFIFNPNSGKGKIKNSLFEIIDKFTDAGYEVTVYPTKHANDCERKIQSCASQYDIAVISGGDGTLNEAVNGMLRIDKDSRIPIGYIPSGTMNDFASTNNIPPTPLDAVDEIINGRFLNYDIGSFNNKPFIYVAAFGAFTDVSYATPQINKNILGSAAYFLEGLKSLPRIKGVNTRIVTDSGEVIQTNAALVLIMNSTSVGGFTFGKFYDIDTSDGIFEIAVVPKSVNILDLPVIIAGIRNGETEVHGASIISAKSAHITTDEPVKWTLDGEFGGEYDSVDFVVNHNAVQFICENKDIGGNNG
ncbi:MAG: YegS/Rv2252/BmrU family lipid kinase [Clostridia bacterium]|nr:YegS/Rv2252/BmrU family lipid kinase [Clostridia bacterium]